MPIVVSLRAKMRTIRTLAILAVPGQIVARKGEWLLQMSLHSPIHGKANHMVQQVVSDGAYDIRWTYNVPLGTDLLAICCQAIFLWVVEVVLQLHTLVSLEARICGRTDVKAVMLRACLQQEALRSQSSIFETLHEVHDEICVQLGKSIGV